MSLIQVERIDVGTGRMLRRTFTGKSRQDAGSVQAARERERERTLSSMLLLVFVDVDIGENRDGYGHQTKRLVCLDAELLPVPSCRFPIFPVLCTVSAS